MGIQRWLLVEQTDHGTDQAQRTAASATRDDPPPHDTGVLVPSQPQPCCQARNDQQRESKQGKQARPRHALLPTGLGKAQPPCRLAKARLTARSMGLFCHGLLGRIGPIGHHIPASPVAMGSPLPTHRHPQRWGGWAQESRRPSVRRRVWPAKRRVSSRRHTLAIQSLVLFFTRITNATPKSLSNGNSATAAHPRSAVTRTRRRPPSG